MSRLKLCLRQNEESEISFHLKSYETEKGINALIRVNFVCIPIKVPTHPLSGICGEYLIRRDKRDKKKLLCFERINPLYFYGNITDLKWNYRRDIANLEARIINFEDKKTIIPNLSGYHIYYKIPLKYLRSEIIEESRFGLIESIFRNIIRAIKENPETLCKNKTNGNNPQGLYHFPESFVQEFNKHKTHYSIAQTPPFYFDKKRKRFILRQY